MTVAELIEHLADMELQESVPLGVLNATLVTENGPVTTLKFGVTADGEHTILIG